MKKNSFPRYTADLKASSLQKKLGPHHCLIVTVDTISSPSTATPGVTRNHGEDKRGAEKVEEGSHGRHSR